MLTTILATVFIVFSDLQVNIIDYGAKADEITDCTPAFNKAYAALKVQLLANENSDRRLEGTIRVPSAPKSYLIGSPIIIQDNYIKIKGDGYGSRLYNTGFGPTFIFGIRTQEKTATRQVVLDPRYTPPRAGKLTIGGNGRRLCGDSSIVFHGSPFDLGPIGADKGYTRWKGVKVLVIDLAIENNETEWRQHGILSLGGYNSPTIFSLGRGGVRNQYDFKFTDEAGIVSQGSFIGVEGLNKISLQLDLETKSFKSWVNGRETPFNINYNGTSGLGYNSFDPFLIGCDPNTADGRVPVGSSRRKMPDFTLWGLSISDKLKYSNDPIQTQLNGSIISDSYQYGLNADCIGMLYGDDKVASSRLVSGFSGKKYRIIYGYALQTDQLSLLGGQKGNTLEDLQLATLVPVTPVVHTLGVLDFTCNRVLFKGGTQNLSAIPSTASYYTRLNSCDFDAVDYSIVGSWSIIRAKDTRFRQVGRGALLTQASDVRFDGGFVAFTSPYTDTIASMFGGLYGGKYRFSDFDIDMEGPVCNIAPFYVEQSPNLNTLFDLTRLYLGTGAKDRPIVVSKKAIGGNAWPYKINLEDIDTIAGTPSTSIQERLP